MKRYILLTAVVLLFSLVFLSCSDDNKVDISGYENEAITVVGLSDKELSISVKELTELECVSKTTTSTSNKIGKVTATGPTLETLCNKYDKKQTDFNKITVIAKDGYEIELTKKVLKDNETIILAFGIDNEPLSEKHAPIRIIIPKSNSAFWVSGVSKLIFSKE